MHLFFKQNETGPPERSLMFQIGTNSICDQYAAAPAVGSSASKKRSEYAWTVTVVFNRPPMLLRKPLTFMRSNSTSL